jgi:hypothetical protein
MASRAVINCLVSGEQLPEAKRYNDLSDLLPRLQTVLSRRLIRATPAAKGSADHRNCHRRAAERLRREIKNLSRFYLPLLKQRNRLQTLRGERAATLRRLEKLEENISITEAEVEALEAALVRDGGIGAGISAELAGPVAPDCGGECETSIIGAVDRANGHD